MKLRAIELDNYKIERNENDYTLTITCKYNDESELEVNITELDEISALIKQAQDLL